MKRPTQHEINRVILGNQILIMRALEESEATHPSNRNALRSRARDVTKWWHIHYGDEEIAAIGDKSDLR